jgi:AcrR family transcriptional regulator
MTNLTKQQILKAFQSLVSQKGLRETTLDDLAKQLKISKKTIYKYYNSKDELVTELVDEIITDLGKIAEQSMQSSLPPMERCLAVFTDVGSYLCQLNQCVMADIEAYYPNLFAKMEQIRAERIAGFTDILNSGVDSGDFKPLNPTVASKMITASIEAVLNPAFLNQNSLTTNEAVSTLKTIVLQGVQSN